MSKILNALRNCLDKPKCKDCHWDECNEFHETVEIPVGLAQAIYELLNKEERTIHELKILPTYFEAVQKRNKKFELRKNDRNFHRGDILRLQEWDDEKYTGNEVDVLVQYILYDWHDGLQDGYCIMSIEKISDDNE